MDLLEFLNDKGLGALGDAPYRVSVKQDGDYYLLKYNQIESDFASDIVKQCRGCIVKYTDNGWKYCARAFDKFFNVGEVYADDIDWASASVQEKIDGSLIKFWYDNGWRISTNGTIDAFKAPLADINGSNYGALVLQALRSAYGDEHDFFNDLDVCNTYMFELVSPYTQIVIPYEKTELYFLGARDMIKDKEINPEQFTRLCEKFKVPQRYPLNSLDKAVAAAAALGNKGEGFVVCDKYFNRIKIKSPWYLAAHYLGNNGVVTEERLLDVILKNETEEFCSYIKKYNNKIAELKHELIQARAIAHTVIDWFDNIEGLSRAEYAAEVKSVCTGPYRAFQDFCFKYYDGMTWDKYVKDWNAAKWLKLLRSLR